MLKALIKLVTSVSELVTTTNSVTNSNLQGLTNSVYVNTWAGKSIHELALSCLDSQWPHVFFPHALVFTLSIKEVLVSLVS